MHPLAIEDTQHFGQRPKLDEYGDYVLLVFYGDARSTGLLPVEVHSSSSGGYVVSVRPGLCEPLAERQQRLRARPASEEYVVYRVLDALTDSFFPVVAAIDDKIETTRGRGLTKVDEGATAQIFQVKRDLVDIRRIVTPQRDLLARRRPDPMLPGFQKDATHDWFRDVYDHMVRISELVDFLPGPPLGRARRLSLHRVQPR